MMKMIDGRGKLQGENQLVPYIETMEEAQLQYGNQFNELTKKYMFIVSVQQLAPEWKELFTILPMVDMQMMKEMVIHIDRYTIPESYKRNSFSLTTQQGMDSKQFYFEIERFSTGLKIDLDVYNTPLGMQKLAILMKMAMDSYMFTLSLNALKHLVLSPEEFVLNEFIVKNSGSHFQSTVSLYNSYVNCSAKGSRFRNMLEVHAEQLRANAAKIDGSSREVVLIIPKEVAIAWASSVEEKFFFTGGEKSTQVREKGIIMDLGNGITILPFTRPAGDGDENFDNQKFFRENNMFATVSYYDMKHVLDTIRNPLEFKENGFYTEIYNAKTNKPHKIYLKDAISVSERFVDGTGVPVPAHTELILTHNLEKRLDDDKRNDPFLFRPLGGADFQVCSKLGHLRDVDVTYAIRLSEIVIQNIFEKKDVENVNYLLGRLTQIAKGTPKLAFFAKTGTFTANLKTYSFVDNNLVIGNELTNGINELFAAGFWTYMTGFPLFDVACTNAKGNEPGYQPIAELHSSMLQIFGDLKILFNVEAKNETEFLWAMMQIIIFDLKGTVPTELAKITGKYAANKYAGISSDGETNGMLVSEFNKILGTAEGDKTAMWNYYGKFALGNVKPLQKLIILFMMMSDFTGKNLITLCENGIPPPVSARILRPQIRVNSFCGILCIKGGALGYSLTGIQKLLETDSSEDLSKVIHLSGKQGIAIIHKSLKVKKSAMLITDYLSGLGIHPCNRKTYDPARKKYGGDIIVELGGLGDFNNIAPHTSLSGRMVVNPVYCPRDSWDDVLPTTGFSNLIWNFDKLTNSKSALSDITLGDPLFVDLASTENYKMNTIDGSESYSPLGRHETGLIEILQGKGSVMTGVTNFLKRN